jgi:multidrug efflux pump subunit AcrA (membrane-fusion protein)
LEGNGARCIDAVLPADMAARLKPGARLAFRYPGGVGAARLVGISARSDGGGSGRAAVLAVIEGTPVPGSAVELSMAVDAAAGVRVPLAAVQQQRKGNASVLIVGPDKRLRQMPVRLVTISGSSAVVTGKLTLGDLVVAAGAEFLEPGITVRPQFAQR